MKPARLALLPICILAVAPSLIPAASQAAVPQEAEQVDAFLTPSGNIACATWPEDEGSVRCDISEYRYTPPPRPDYCDTDWGGSFSIEPDGSVDVLCAGDTVYSLDYPRPAAGTSVAIGRSVCTVETYSVKCVASGTDGGLFLSPERYESF